MPDREELIQALARLDPAALEDVVNSAYRQRNDTGDALQAMPDHEATPERFARWLAQRHLSADAAIERVVYLPTDSPADEIRLLEVNRFLNLSDDDVVEPLDFSPDTEPNFKVFVADVTTGQWERIKQAPGSILPTGWNLESNQIFTRG